MTTILSGGRFRDAVDLSGGSEQHIYPGAGTVPLLGTREIQVDGKTVLLSQEATYDAMYRRQPALYAVVSLLVKALARLPLHAFQEFGEGDRRRVRAHQLARLIRNPYKRGSSWDWKVRLAYDLFVHGKHLQVKLRSDAASPPSGIRPVFWPLVETIHDGTSILGFIIHTGAKRVPVPIEDAVYYEMPGGGISPVEVLKRRLAIQEASAEYQGAALKNGITPRAAFSFKDLKAIDREFVRGEINKLYTGPSNAANYAILTGEASMSAVGVSAIDLALIDQLKLGNEEVCATYGVSPSVAGFSADKVATFASQQEFRKSLYVDALGPILTMVEETMQSQLVDVEPAWDGLFVEFLLDELLRPDVMQRMQAYLLSQQSSSSTIDDRRALENQPKFNIAGVTDVPLIPMNMRPAAVGMFDGEPAPAAAQTSASGLENQLVLEAMRVGSQPKEGS